MSISPNGVTQWASQIPHVSKQRSCGPMPFLFYFYQWDGQLVTFQVRNLGANFRLLPSFSLPTIGHHVQSLSPCPHFLNTPHLPFLGHITLAHLLDYRNSFRVSFSVTSLSPAHLPHSYWKPLFKLNPISIILGFKSLYICSPCWYQQSKDHGLENQIASAELSALALSNFLTLCKLFNFSVAIF